MKTKINAENTTHKKDC